jgi:hypothetical protein
MACNFPATVLLQMRREAAERANDEADPTPLMNFVLAIDTLRAAHFDVDGCRCWEEAVKRNA